MQLLALENIHINQEKLHRLETIMNDIYRLILYSRYHEDDDLLDTYLNSMTNLKELLGIKNAQMEAQNEAEAVDYLKHLKISVDYVLEEIVGNRNFESELQLFQLFRKVSPETSLKHPNRYRETLVQVGAHVCPEPAVVPHLVSELFHKIKSINHPVTRAIYFHHEMIRIHPFADGNGRVTRVAKNWMLMYALYPPIFINDASQKKQYIGTLAESFQGLSTTPDSPSEATAAFFEQELDRLLINANLLYRTISEIGKSREAGQHDRS